MSIVLVTVCNGDLVIDSGSGVVLYHQHGKSYILTCAHTLRSLSKRIAEEAFCVKVAGKLAKQIQDDSMTAYDLAVLTVDESVGSPANWDWDLKGNSQSVICEGYIPFFNREFKRISVEGTVKERLETISPEGDKIHYLKIVAKKKQEFNKGLSGGPVYLNNKVVGISRLKEQGKNFSDVDVTKADANSCGYAILMTPAIEKLLSSIVPCLNNTGKSLESSGNELPEELNPDRPPPLPEPKNKLDPQKGRLGGKPKSFGRRLTIENVIPYQTWYLFDAVLECTDEVPLTPPFIFHIHDSFPKSVIWVRKTDGYKAVLKEIEANGVFTWGVQFKDKNNKWQRLEYDLKDYKDVNLNNYEKMNYGARRKK